MTAPTQGPHFFCADLDGSSAVLRGQEARHLAVVLRARAGDPVSLADGRATLCQAQVRTASAEEVTCEILARHHVPPPRTSLTVVHALPKGRKLDDVVQRLSEVGVDRLVPVHSQRAQVSMRGDKAAKALARWRAVALAAGKQARRVRLLDVADVGRWEQAFGEAAAGAVLWEQASQRLRAVLGEATGGAPELVLGVGPEGGLTAEEVAAAGLPAATLGATILRTETAALVAASVVLADLGRLG